MEAPGGSDVEGDGVPDCVLEADGVVLEEADDVGADVGDGAIAGANATLCSSTLAAAEMMEDHISVNVSKRTTWLAHQNGVTVVE